MSDLSNWLNSINSSKVDLMETDLDEKEFSKLEFVINRCLSYFPDTIMQVNEINQNPHLDSKLKYDFLLNSIRRGRRFSKWFKKESVADLDVVKEYYGYSDKKALDAISILSPTQIDEIRNRLCKGGMTGNGKSIQ